MNNDNAMREEDGNKEYFYFFHPLKRAKRLAKKHIITGQRMRTAIVRPLIILFEVILLCGNLVSCGDSNYNGRELISSTIHLNFNDWNEWGKVIVLYLAVIYLIVLVRSVFLKKGKYQKNIRLLWFTNIILVLTVLFYVVTDYFKVLFATYLCTALSFLIGSIFLHGTVYEIQNGEEIPLKESFIKRKINIKEKMQNMTESEKEAHKKKMSKIAVAVILPIIVVLFLVINVVSKKIETDGTYEYMVSCFNANSMIGIWDISGINGNLVIYGEGQAYPNFQCGIEGNLIQGQLGTEEAEIFSLTSGQFTMIAKELINEKSIQFRVDISFTLPNGENKTYTDVIITKLNPDEIYQKICEGVINQAQKDTGSKWVPFPLYVDYNGEMVTEIDNYGNMFDEILYSNNGQILGGAQLSCVDGGALSINCINLSYVVTPAMEFMSNNTYLE